MVSPSAEEDMKMKKDQEEINTPNEKTAHCARRVLLSGYIFQGSS